MEYFANMLLMYTQNILVRKKNYYIHQYLQYTEINIIDNCDINNVNRIALFLRYKMQWGTNTVVQLTDYVQKKEYFRQYVMQ